MRPQQRQSARLADAAKASQTADGPRSAIDQVVFFQRYQLKRGPTIDRLYYWLLVTKLAVVPQLGLSLAQGTTVMGVKPARIEHLQPSLRGFAHGSGVEAGPQLPR